MTPEEIVRAFPPRTRISRQELIYLVPAGNDDDVMYEKDLHSRRHAPQH